ncbi:MAG TPA: hypothetical protein VGN95_20685 [Pyrinomonadaceae bacterium]|nr:hypothetical protein [Pyrinomonadaceae bacterium]
MNAETVALIVRPFQEILDDTLTAIVGGVVNEPIFYDLKEDLYLLAEPATDVRGITGMVSERAADGTLQPQQHTFQKSIDYVFRSNDNAVFWLPEGQRPDDETVFYVDYFRRDSRSPLSDINIGSVTRTLSEAIGREIATVYQQINEAYLSGFVDTAKGQSLNRVVAILGVKRKTKESAIGLVTFFRDPAAGDGNITIPENTLLSTDKGEATFFTAELRTLQRGQVRIDVPIRATPASGGSAGIVKAGDITKVAQPIAGINRVTNFEPTILGNEDETDPQLRARAKAVLRGLGKGTLAALANAIFENRAKLVEVYDPDSPPLKRTAPGTVRLLVESEPERFLSLRAAVEQTRAAGVHAMLLARYVFFKPRIRARIKPGVPPAGKVKITEQIIEAMQKYVDGLSAGNPARGDELLKAITSVQEVSNKAGEVKIVDVITSRADVGGPEPEKVVKTLLDAVNAAEANLIKAGSEIRDAALKTALDNVLKNSAQPATTGQANTGAAASPESEKVVKALLDAVNTAEANVTATNSAARDAALTISLDNVLNDTLSPVPTSQRIPDRSLVEGLVKGKTGESTGQRATDAEIEAGLFQVKAVVNGENWWVTLDVEPADIRLEEA